MKKILLLVALVATSFGVASATTNEVNAPSVESVAADHAGDYVGIVSNVNMNGTIVADQSDVTFTVGGACTSHTLIGSIDVTGTSSSGMPISHSVEFNNVTFTCDGNTITNAQGDGTVTITIAGTEMGSFPFEVISLTGTCDGTTLHFSVSCNVDGYPGGKFIASFQFDGNK